MVGGRGSEGGKVAGMWVVVVVVGMERVAKVSELLLLFRTREPPLRCK